MGFALIHSRHMTTKKEVHNGSTSNVGHDDWLPISTHHFRSSL
jgi:hypothetical protein